MVTIIYPFRYSCTLGWQRTSLDILRALIQFLKINCDLVVPLYLGLTLSMRRGVLGPEMPFALIPHFSPEYRRMTIFCSAWSVRILNFALKGHYQLNKLSLKWSGPLPFWDRKSTQVRKEPQGLFEAKWKNIGEVAHEHCLLGYKKLRLCTWTKRSEPSFGGL